MAAKQVVSANIARDVAVLELHQKIAGEVQKIEETWKNKVTGTRALTK